MKVELPGGGWAEVRDPELLTERERRPFLKSMEKVLSAPERDDSDGPYALYDHVMAFWVTSWSFGDTFDPDVALDLPIATYDVLRSRADVFLKAITPDFSVSPDEDSPTTPSGA
jgi:hypothetical protein